MDKQIETNRIETENGSNLNVSGQFNKVYWHFNSIGLIKEIFKTQNNSKANELKSKDSVKKTELIKTKNLIKTNDLKVIEQKQRVA